ncbi:MAG: exodeoxyribonuclease VII large subunit, partial [Hyphomicrobiaceae bacterium]|nr:exodeoxyribonuclease VII large subunit [Hyphomicrobiaceae bacterium]
MDNPDNSDKEPQGNVAEFSVSELSFAIKRAIEDGFSHVRVRGELGRIARPASGHVYLDLKDEKAVLSGIIWRGQAAKLKVQPEQGMEVIATGRLTTYPGQSRYQIIIDSLEPAGAGALLAQLEKLKKKLAGEGLFDEERKKPIPFLPQVVGIVTSPSGAVIRDMLHGFEERFPVHVIVWPVRVQGETCGAEVAAAIRGFNAIGQGGDLPRPDVLIVGRGGGSLEDLWGFNEEQVARAVAESEIPLISAVGHETDWTVIDLVADARAPTPTKAAEWAVPVLSDLLERLVQNRQRLGTAQRRTLDQRAIVLKAASRGLPKLS